MIKSASAREGEGGNLETTILKGIAGVCRVLQSMPGEDAVTSARSERPGEL